MSNKKRIVFLDVDGVLHPFHGHIPENQITTFHRACMMELERIITETDAEIVLSTSWRNFASTRNRLAANLAEYGLGFSRWIEPDNAISAKTPSALKYQKILSFVQTYNPPEWVVIDDEDLVSLSGADPTSIMAQLFCGRFVKTNPNTGLTGAYADKAIEILNSD